MALSTSHERRQRQRGEARRAILDAAGALLAERGIAGFSMRRLSARCGYALPTIYHHFGDKTRLLDALLDERFGELVSALRSAPRVGDPARVLRGMIRAVVDFGLRNPSHYQALVSALRDGTEPPAAEEARALFEAPVHRLLEAGRLCYDNAELVIQVLWAFSHGLISLRTSRADLDWSPELLDVALEGMLHGVVFRDSARPAEERS
jgi:AcrR family transcriptional regulator